MGTPLESEKQYGMQEGCNTLSLFHNLFWPWTNDQRHPADGVALISTVEIQDAVWGQKLFLRFSFKHNFYSKIKNQIL